MTQHIRIRHAFAEPVRGLPGAFQVVALGDTLEYRHEGPNTGHDFFTKGQAVFLARRVKQAGNINPERWICASRTWEEVELDWHYEAMNEMHERSNW